MAQKRYFDFLADHTDFNLRTYLKDVLPFGKYIGLNMDISSGNIVISLGKYIASNGIIIEETTELDIGLLPSVTVGNPLEVTIIGTGPAISTVQRTAFNYSVETGILLEEDLLLFNKPFVIIGWLKYTGTTWVLSNAPNAVALPVKNNIILKPVITSIVPFTIITLPNIGPVQRVQISNNFTYRIPVNNEFSIKNIKLTALAAENISINVSLENADNALLSIGTFAIGTTITTLDILMPASAGNLLDVTLTLDLTVLSGGASYFYFKEIIFEEEPSFI